MKKIRTIIVDDEFAARNILKKLIQLSFPDIEVIATAENLLKAVDLIKEMQPDLVFLDVEMPNYAGYEISSFFEKIDFHIIFVTAYNQYAINAFELNAVDYLLKPIDRDRLKESIERVKEKINANEVYSNYDELVAELDNKTSKNISFTEAGKKHIINLDKIIAITAEGAYSKIFIDGKPTIMVSKNIGQLEKDFKEHSCFTRTHKSWIINLNHIETFDNKNNVVKLSKQIIAKISRYKKDDLFQLINETM